MRTTVPVMRALLPAALLALLATAACKPDSTPPADAATPAPASDGAADKTAQASHADDPAPSAAEPVQDAAPEADAPQPDLPDGNAGDPGLQSVAGNWHGVFPCADCPGIENTVLIYTDGRYTRTEVYQERDTTFETAGKWSRDADGKRIRLQPDDPKDAAIWIQQVSPNELKILDADGNPIDTGLPYSLIRIDH